MMAKVSEMNRKNFFQNFSIFSSAGGLAGKVLLAFHTPSLRICIQLYCSFIQPCVASSYTRSALTSDPFQHWRHPTPSSQELSPNSPKWLVAQWFSAPLQTCVQRWIPPGLYYVVLKFMLGWVRTILPSRFQFKFEKMKPQLGSQEPPKGVCPP